MVNTSSLVDLRKAPLSPTHDLRVKPGTAAFPAVIEALDLKLPTVVGKVQQRSSEPIYALCMGPDWWLIVQERLENDWAKMLAPLRAQFHLSLVDVSAQRTQFQIEGPKARQTLEHVWEQDLRDKSFPVGSCSHGLMAKAPTVLWRYGENRYRILVRSSFAGHLWAVLVDAIETEGIPCNHNRF